MPEGDGDGKDGVEPEGAGTSQPRTPPHPDDRLWRHPSEVAAGRVAGTPTPPHRPSNRPPDRWESLRLRAPALAVALVAATLAVGVTALWGAIGGDDAEPVAAPTTTVALVSVASASDEPSWMGVRGDRLDHADLGMPSDAPMPAGLDAGAVHVTRVATHGPAAEAGLRPDDVILAVGDRAVHSMHELTEAVGAHPPGRRVLLRIWRDGAHVVLAVRLEAWPDDTVTWSAEP